ncbi:Enoyl-[acyl-carrier-protein] reductase [FMN] [Candidatus Paraburkholderia calva]|nr:Enoyl-[acyl-carrier-protein] reductase [FMN] [Candidatus Paraburkholderia calva]
MGTLFSPPLTSLLNCRSSDRLGRHWQTGARGTGGAVSAAGGFGLLGMVCESPHNIEARIAVVRAMTDRPFGVNLIPTGTDPALLDAELDACLDAHVAAMCFWEVRADLIARAKAAVARVLYQAGSLDEALAAEQAGADAIIAQGVEAGGHVKGRIGSMSLLPEVVSRVRVSVVASGGIANGAGLAVALVLGASGVHCGMVFLVADESYAHEYHKQRIVDAHGGETVRTDIYAITRWPAGSPARVLRNSVTDEVRDHPLGNDPYALLGETVASDAQGPIVKYETVSLLRGASSDLEKMALFAGESSALLVEARVPAREIVETMVREAGRALDRVQRMRGNAQSWVRNVTCPSYQRRRPRPPSIHRSVPETDSPDSVPLAPPLPLARPHRSACASYRGPRQRTRAPPNTASAFRPPIPLPTDTQCAMHRHASCRPHRSRGRSAFRAAR